MDFHDPAFDGAPEDAFPEFVTAGQGGALLADVEQGIAALVRAGDVSRTLGRRRPPAESAEGEQLGPLLAAMVVRDGQAHPAAGELLGCRKCLPVDALLQLGAKHLDKAGLARRVGNLDNHMPGGGARSVHAFGVELEALDGRRRQQLKDDGVVPDLARFAGPARGGAFIDEAHRRPAAVMRRLHNRERALVQGQQVDGLGRHRGDATTGQHGHNDETS